MGAETRSSVGAETGLSVGFERSTRVLSHVVGPPCAGTLVESARHSVARGRLGRSRPARRQRRMDVTLAEMSANHVSGTPWREAVAIAHAAAAPLPAEIVALRDATGRVTAVPVTARMDLPGFDTAAMDGYAVAGPGPWNIDGRVMAGGEAWTTHLVRGHCVEIMTGAAVPAGADAVIPYEQSTVDEAAHLTVSGQVSTRTHIRRAGEDSRLGDPLVPAGRLLTPAVCGLLAQGGADTVPVHRRPRVRLLVTGDEVIAAGVPGTGEVRDVFGPMITALVAAWGGSVTDHRILRDDPALLAESLLAADAEVIAVSGSSSAGRADHLRPVLDKIGARLLVDQVACRPGHPQVLASLPGGRWLVGLPGNPFAGLVAAMTLLRPLLGAMTGSPIEPAGPPTRPGTISQADASDPAEGRRGSTLLRLPVIGDVPLIPGVTRLVPVVADGDRVIVVPGARPASLAGAAAADALAILEYGWTTGTPADLLPLTGLL
ncbi:molybdopterin-binding protein [Winogradskya consettensis]|uniref:Molybdopterin molybdenumtransferase n=3 Tax=Winogradskya consettensis TaxID=113560 RepID=A0A919VVK4_9ACTN|nr:molybdopterin molybdenumtransferase MoeA [Actinoplanes consettensis]